MFNLSEETKEMISMTTGLTSDALANMTDEEIDMCVEARIGKKLSASKPSTKITGSGDDSVLIDKGKVNNLQDKESLMDKIKKFLGGKKRDKDILFEDTKSMPITDSVKQNPNNKNISGDVRVSKGMYRTDEEKEQYINESLEKDLP